MLAVLFPGCIRGLTPWSCCSITWTILGGVAPQNRHLSPSHFKTLLLVEELNALDGSLLSLKLNGATLTRSSVKSSRSRRLRFLAGPVEAGRSMV
jgi:hypothetical protein